MLSNPLTALPPWLVALEYGLAPGLTGRDLAALASGLRDDSGEILAGDTVAWEGNQDVAAPLAACPVAYALWRGRGLATVGLVLGEFNALMAAAKDRLGPWASPWDLPSAWDSGRLTRLRLLAAVEALLAAWGAPP